MDDKTVKKLQRASIGAQYPIHTEDSKHFRYEEKPKTEFPDLGESTKEDPLPEEALIRCARCGMEHRGWTGGSGQGIWKGEMPYCCKSCAENSGCDCVAEAERHTGLNLAQGETSAAPDKPI